MRTLITAVAVLSSLTLPVHAGSFDWLTQYKRPNLHWGQIGLHPYYGLSQTYDSNIYLVPRDQPNGAIVGAGVRGSWITKNNLGLEALLPLRRLHTVAAGYDFEAQNYTTQPESNNTVNHKTHLDYVYAGAYGLTFKAGDQYVNTTDQAFSELVERNRRWANRVYTELDYNPANGVLAGGLDASHTTHKYVGPEFGRLLNRYEQRAGFNVGYKVQPKTKLYVSYHRGIVHYTVHRELPNQDKNSKSHSMGLGLSGALAPKVEGQVETGMTYREYDETPIGGATRVTRQVTVATNLVYRPQDRTTFTLALQRYLQESVSGPNRFFVANNAILDIVHKLPRKFSTGFNFALAIDKYPEAQTVAGGFRGNRRDDIYQTGLWVAYDIQEWLSTGVSYLYRERNSTLSGQFNYQDHQTALNLAFKF